MVQIEIDGIYCEVSEYCNIIEAARLYNIFIPKFCYHKKLSVAANCRMCLVEVEKSPKLVPACTLKPTPGMKIYTTTPAVLKAQRDIMEFLLINHPLDCPICDQGGECELQDLSLKHGFYKSFFKEQKRLIKNENFGPLVETVFSRCILCTRCVRFGAEVAGVVEIGVIGRGVHSRISTFVKKTVTSVLSGNIIDLCPVGALTSKVFKFKARSWELTQHNAISPHDCVGSNLFLHVKDNTVLRVVSRENEEVNEMWISDRDRFSYEGVVSLNRLKKPMIKLNGFWKELEWEELFFSFLNIFLQSEKNFGVIMSPNCTNEEFFLGQKLFRYLGTKNIDCFTKHIGLNSSFLYKIPPRLEFSFNFFNLPTSSIFLIGASIFLEQPVLVARFNKLASIGGKVCSISYKNLNFPFSVQSNLVVEQSEFTLSLIKILKTILDLQKLDSSVFNNFVTGVEEAAIAKILVTSEKKELVLGEAVLAHEEFSLIYEVCTVIASLLGTKLSFLYPGSNSFGGWFFGCVPSKVSALQTLNEREEYGYSSYEMFKNKLDTYVLVNIDPATDFLYDSLVLEKFKYASNIIVFSPYFTKGVEEYSTLVIPTTLTYESGGSYINCLGIFQEFKKIISPLSSILPLWKIFLTLGAILKLPDFSYQSLDIITSECRDFFLKHEYLSRQNVEFSLEVLLKKILEKKNCSNNNMLFTEKVYDTSLYKSDLLVRHAKSLQEITISSGL